jgi:hypothetical protein
MTRNQVRLPANISGIQTECERPVAHRPEFNYAAFGAYNADWGRDAAQGCLCCRSAAVSAN